MTTEELAKLTPEEKRIKIAEICGWKNADHPEVMARKIGWALPEAWCENPEGELCFNHDRPDYLNDLNAIHEAEKVLRGLQWREYCDNLKRLVVDNLPELVSATAAQRSDAFLLTLG